MVKQQTHNLLILGSNPSKGIMCNNRNKRKHGSKKKRRLGSDKCWYCGKKLLSIEVTIDHVVPKALGGSNLKDNKVIACRKCNEDKGMIDLEQYRAHLELDLPKGERAIFAGEREGYYETDKLKPFIVIDNIEDAIDFAREGC